MLTQLSGLYFRAYQLAIGVARRTERCFQFEKGVEPSSYIQFGYWDSLRKGLLAGERLFLDLKRLELAYMDQSPTEFELIKHVSLRAMSTSGDWDAATKGASRNGETIPPTGKFAITLTEQMFADDFKNHDFRRIRSVSITVPCVVGPYTGVTGTLRLISSSLNGLPRYVPVAAIATSSGQNDSGRFELNFRDDRYLPFEGAGVESEWIFELPTPVVAPDKPPKPFDYTTISDLIMHIRYTAREMSS